MRKCWSFWCEYRATCERYQADHMCAAECKWYSCKHCRLEDNVKLCEVYRFGREADIVCTRTSGNPNRGFVYRNKRYAKEKKPPEKSSGMK